jgi:hypothetical protein
MKTYLSLFFAHLNGFASLGGTVIFMELFAFVDNTLGPQVIDVLKYALPVQILVSLYCAVKAAVFTFHNFDEVWSRRMEWSSSRSGKLESRLTYSIKIFFQCFFAIPGVVVAACVIVALILFVCFLIYMVFANFMKG